MMAGAVGMGTHDELLKNAARYIRKSITVSLKRRQVQGE